MLLLYRFPHVVDRRNYDDVFMTYLKIENALKIKFRLKPFFSYSPLSNLNNPNTQKILDHLLEVIPFKI